jgi:hypothetical protein
MPKLTAVVSFEQGDQLARVAEQLASNQLVFELLICGGHGTDLAISPAASAKSRTVEADLQSGAGLNQLIDQLDSDYLLVCLPGFEIELGQRAIERLVAVAEDTGAGWVYSDFRDKMDGQLTDHPLIDYQSGAIRDSFDFGPLFLISRRAALLAINSHGRLDPKSQWGGLYDLRLKLSIDSTFCRIGEPLYNRIPVDLRASGEKQFDYVNPARREYQTEMERIASGHLKRIGAYLAPHFESRPPNDHEFRMRASVVIPVRNRERTIRDAVASALSQKTDFEFNVIVVDNHSTDQTTEILKDIAANDNRLINLTPARKDLGIGGCWNEAVYSEHCGKYAVQLDSDDLYSDEFTLAKIVQKFEDGRYAMVIGSYRIVNFDLQEVPPGLIDHREWTVENGRNNALRINGLGAPRAFFVPVLRLIGFPDVSYGEDYALALRISRTFEIGRIFEPIYFARRWEGNSDAALPLNTANRFDSYKDYLRTVEILARKRMNAK